MAVNNICELIGRTPIVKLGRFSEHFECRAPIYAKVESLNVSGNMKDRCMYYIIKEAMARGEITKTTMVVGTTGGGSGISLAMICAAMGLACSVIMPGDTPEHTREQITFYGANAVIFPAGRGVSGAEDELKRLKAANPDIYEVSQFTNTDGVKAHRETTAREIIEDFGQVDYFIAGVGTGSSITGVGEALKGHNPECRVIAVEPIDSPVLSGGFSGSHNITGIGPGFVPDVLNTYILDEIIKVRTPDSQTLVQHLARLEGLLCGISSGAALSGALNVARRPDCAGKKILTILPDDGLRYLIKP